MTIAKARKRILRSGGFNYDADAVSEETGTPTGPEPSKTVQSEKDNADINVIVKRFGVTGQLPTNVRVPRFGDFDTVNDFQTAMNAVREAQTSFMAMPAAVRARFGNDPQAFLEFCGDEKNIDELRKLGLANAVNADIIPPVPNVLDTQTGDKNVDSKSGADSGGASSGKAGKGAKGD